jgi:hypothetical protein
MNTRSTHSKSCEHQQRPVSHDKLLQKKLCNTGEAYVSRCGNLVPGNQYINLDCNYPRKWIELINKNEHSLTTFGRCSFFSIRHFYVVSFIKHLSHKKGLVTIVGEVKVVLIYFSCRRQIVQCVCVCAHAHACKRFFLKTFLCVRRQSVKSIE